MAAQTKSKVTPKYKTKYRVQNWPVYEASLRQRGDITVWFDEGAIGAWNSLPSGHAGGQQRRLLERKAPPVRQNVVHQQPAPRTRPRHARRCARRSPPPSKPSPFS